MSHPRDQLSAIPPKEYAERFVRFIRANIKTRKDIQRERSESAQPSTHPLRTIQEQEDRRLLEKAQVQLQKEDSSRGEKKERDVGRTRALTPDHDQIIPYVTVSGSSRKASDGSQSGIRAERNPSLTGEPIVESPTEEKSLGTEPWKVTVQEDGSVARRS